MKKILKRKILSVLFFAFVFANVIFNYQSAKAMPFYNLNPKPIVVMAEFQTSFKSSTKERKHNIKLSAKSLDNVFLDVGEEFSFNKTVGERTVSRGYKTAKIIVDGEFVDGVGGGICQVSTTLYNAVLLSGLKITEFHPHSLQVSYVAPSFDAMVNSGSADLRFVNNTDNPVIINTFVTDDTIKISITGEKPKFSFVTQSVVVGYVEPEDYEIQIDDEGEYPDLYEGESLIIKNQKAGVRSEGLIIKFLNGKPISSVVIRRDIYKPIRGIKVMGTKKTYEGEMIEENLIEKENINLIYNIYKKPFDNRINLW